MKKNKGLFKLMIGIGCIIAGFIWMILSRTSTGPFLILSGIGGAIMVSGIIELRKKSSWGKIHNDRKYK